MCVYEGLKNWATNRFCNPVDRVLEPYLYNPNPIYMNNPIYGVYTVIGINSGNKEC